MKRTWHLRIRKTHRYLGLFIGIQFLAWTLGGLYFSWTNLDEIHGDHQKNPEPLLSLADSLISPSTVLSQIQGDSLVDLKLITILGKPTYQINYLVKHGGHPMKHTLLADAKTGHIRSELTKNEAITLAKSRFNENVPIESVTYLKATSNGHEYRKKPLPAYAVTFGNDSHTTIYVASILGQVTSFRHTSWRWFDFLWMLHTMDYDERDNFNNFLLRIFSALGLFTVGSGFALYWISSPGVRNKRKKQNTLVRNT